MDLSSTTLIVLVILFLSTFVRSALGFGDALIAMPLLAMVVGMHVATPLDLQPAVNNSMICGFVQGFIPAEN